MYIATVTACKGDNELGTTIYRDRPIISGEIELVKLQLEELLNGPASFLVQYSREDDQTIAPTFNEGI
ncbi:MULTISPECIES: hypothetical protein [Cyanophyceae]|uniref:hypothetical protein n=1 Tax=Cyanophyceae TaxID=3028117 RepID=UPI0016823688|nr:MULTISPECIES: hypothetical protein [Cyanophyceae]MBD1914291.1 hypothetical protein [Phormidium sp. FACHB-77]MBD2049625.1 hypothetical protein [Leptolyngbya sp. FACHB-60]